MFCSVHGSHCKKNKQITHFVKKIVMATLLAGTSPGVVNAAEFSLSAPGGTIYHDSGGGQYFYEGICHRQVAGYHTSYLATLSRAMAFSLGFIVLVRLARVNYDSLAMRIMYWTGLVALGINTGDHLRLAYHYAFPGEEDDKNIFGIVATSEKGVSPVFIQQIFHSGSPSRFFYRISAPGIIEPEGSSISNAFFPASPAPEFDGSNALMNRLAAVLREQNIYMELEPFNADTPGYQNVSMGSRAGQRLLRVVLYDQGQVRRPVVALFRAPEEIEWVEELLFSYFHNTVLGRKYSHHPGLTGEGRFNSSDFRDSLATLKFDSPLSPDWLLHIIEWLERNPDQTDRESDSPPVYTGLTGLVYESETDAEGHCVSRRLAPAPGSGCITLDLNGLSYYLPGDIDSPLSPSQLSGQFCAALLPESTGQFARQVYQSSNRMDNHRKLYFDKLGKDMAVTGLLALSGEVAGYMLKLFTSRGVTVEKPMSVVSSRAEFMVADKPAVVPVAISLTDSVVAPAAPVTSQPVVIRPLKDTGEFTIMNGLTRQPVSQALASKVTRKTTREQQKDNILEAFARGELVSRGISVKQKPGTGLTEIEYQKGWPQPRPVTLIHKGMRVGLFYYCIDIHLGLAPVKGLYPYSRDLTTSERTRKDSFFSLIPERDMLLPDRDSLLNNIAKKDNQLDTLYPPRGSGRMGEDGRHVSGHDKPVNGNGFLSTNELIIEGYQKAQYQCVIIPCFSTLNSLYKVLKHKASLEQDLSVPELPLVFYDERSGSIKDIVFLSELGITAGNLPELNSNIERIGQVARLAGSKNLQEILLQLPPSRLLAFLHRLPAGVAEATQQLSKPFRDELCEAVMQGDLERVRYYSQHEAVLTAHYYNNGRQQNLLELLIFQVLKDQSGVFKLNSQKLIELGKFLYDHGCWTVVNIDMVKRLPSLAAYILEHGGLYHDRAYPFFFFRNLCETLTSFLRHDIILLEELEVIVKGVKRRFVDVSEQLDKNYTSYLDRLLMDSFNHELDDIHRTGKYISCSLSELVKKTATLFASAGIVANTEVLRQNLERNVQEYEQLLFMKENRDTEKLTLITSLLQNAEAKEPLKKAIKANRYKSYLHEETPRLQYNSPEGLTEVIEVFETLYDPADRYDKPAVSPENARIIAQYIYDNRLELAKALIEQLYETRFQRVKDKRQSIEELLSALDELQGSEASQRARAETITEAVKEMAGTGAAPPPGGEQPDAFGWLRELYRFSPDTTGKSYPDLAQQAINHYYRMLHPDQAEKFAMFLLPVPSLLREHHGVDHVTRTQILAEALIELFIRHDLSFQALFAEQPELRELIPLAMVYHDVTAEVEVKSTEEIRAAEFFERDMRASKRYPYNSVTLVASALRNKNVNTFQEAGELFVPDDRCTLVERRVRYLLRLPDTIDIIRVLVVPVHWKEPQDPHTSSTVFNAGFLDLPESLKNNAVFIKELGNLMEGAKDLAYVTGGAPVSDSSMSGSYLIRYALSGDNTKRKLKIARASNAYDSVRTALDDNVRRALARAAGLFTCQASHEKQDSLYRTRTRADCLREKNDREYLAAIHSEFELRQVRLPEGMTVLQKLMFEHSGSSLNGLSEEQQKEVLNEIGRLQQQGIQPPLGTLTQEVLASPQARKRLREDYGLDVVSERRVYGRDEEGRACYETFLVTRPLTL